MKFCKKCGKEMDDQAMFCPNCGFSELKKQKGSKLKKVLIILLIIVAVVGAGVCGFFALTNLSDAELEAVNKYDADYKETIDTKLLKGKVGESNLIEYSEKLEALKGEYNKLKWKQKIKVKGKKKNIDEQIDGVEDALQDIADKFDASVDDLGTLTVDSGDQIKNCLDNYNKLSEKTQKKTKNYDKLIQDEVDYAILVIDAIPDIDLSDECADIMAKAESAINYVEKNSDKSKITNLSTYEDANKEYQELVNKKNDLLAAQDDMKLGEFSKAKKLLNSLPNNFKYNGVSVKKLKKYMKKNAEYIKMVGNYEAHGVKFNIPGFNSVDTGCAYINVNCSINSKGKAVMSVSGTIPAYIDFKTVFGREWVSTEILSYNVEMNGYGTKKDGYVNVTLKKNSVTLYVNYYNRSYASVTYSIK